MGRFLVLGDENAGVEDVVRAMHRSNHTLIPVTGRAKALFEQAPRLQPSPDGCDEGESEFGSGNAPLSQESFLAEEEKPLASPAFGLGPRQCDDPANDA